ncbi:alkaline phosphatase family protein, partial [Sphingosinicella sp.]|uniref:alkaline phosphatase family protein n=1 Tax=Sphingosinicella sp. TaxID=1917971 RepID=UPI004037B4C4
YQGHAATETCPGHATILTGARPGRAGIIANNWYDLGTTRDDKYVYCAEDERVAGSSSQSYTVSPYHLRVPTLGELMHAADPRSRTVAVAGKDRSAIMMGGQQPAARWWWAGRAFVSHAGVAAPAAVARVNERIARDLTRAGAPLPLPAVCSSRDRAVTAGPATVGAGRLARPANDPGALRATPAFDQAVLDIGDGLRTDMRLGQGPAIDLLILGLSATDYVGHGLGTQGAEMCIQLMALDAALGRFFQRLDRTGIDYVVMLTADHGGLDLPERDTEQAAAGAARVDRNLLASAMGRAIGERLGLTGPVLFGDGAFGDMYVDRALTAAQRRDVRDEAVRAYRAHPQVAAVFTRDELAATPSPSGPPDAWSLIERARASFDSERSGDFLVLLRPRITPIAAPGRGYVATHGSPWDYDRRVPILFWRRGMTGFEQPLAVETADIMPTLAGLIGLAIAPGAIDGHCLDLAAGPATTCPAQ